MSLNWKLNVLFAIIKCFNSSIAQIVVVNTGDTWLVHIVWINKFQRTLKNKSE